MGVENTENLEVKVEHSCKLRTQKGREVQILSTLEHTALLTPVALNMTLDSCSTTILPCNLRRQDY